VTNKHDILGNISKYFKHIIFTGDITSYFATNMDISFKKKARWLMTLFYKMISLKKE
jgi:hypothetical protein